MSPQAFTRHAALGWDADWAQTFASLDGTPGRVARVDRGWLRVMVGADDPTGDADPSDDADTTAGPDGPDGPADQPDNPTGPHVDLAGELLIPQPVGGPTPATGDWVAMRSDGSDHLQIVGVAPRRTELVRRDPAEHLARPQVLAANMDQVWIVHSMDQPLRSGWLDRALVVSYGSGAEPVFVVTKCDIADPGRVERRVHDLVPGLAVQVSSAATGQGLATLRSRVDSGRCAALLGRSGAGKSSLVNAMLDDRVHRTGEVRAGDAKGRHTTTRRSLTLVGGGSVIDAPGVRALGLWQPEEGLALTFPDIDQLSEQCRFGDCTHTHEPGCAVLDARDRDALAPGRYERYITLSS